MGNPDQVFEGTFSMSGELQENTILIPARYILKTS